MNRGGEKIPHMESSEVFRVLKLIPNSARGVYAYIPIASDDVTGTMILGIRDGGDVYVKCVFSSVVEKRLCETTVKAALDRFMETLRTYFAKVGYVGVTFDTFDDHHVNIIGVDYAYVAPMKRGKISKLKSCMKELLERNDKESKLQKTPAKEHVYNFKKYSTGADAVPVYLHIHTKLDSVVLTVRNIDSFGYTAVLPVYLGVAAALMKDELGAGREKRLCFGKNATARVAGRTDQVDQVDVRIAVAQDQGDEDEELSDAQLDRMFSFDDDDVVGLDDVLGEVDAGEDDGEDAGEDDGEDDGDDGEDDGEDDGDDESEVGIDMDDLDFGVDDLGDLTGLGEEDGEDEGEDDGEDDGDHESEVGIDMDDLDFGVDDLGDLTGQGEEDGEDGEDEVAFDLDDLPQSGGSKGERKLWVNRIEERDNIFEKFKHTTSYSRTCPANQHRQPVIVTRAELDKINKEHPGSYYPEDGAFPQDVDKSNFSIKFHTKKNDDFHYICPQFWCVDENVALNIKEDLRLNADGTEYRNKSGEVESKKPGFCKTIHEFGIKYSQASKKESELVDSDGNLTKNAFSYPSFKDDNYCLPCCYKYSDRTPPDFKRSQVKADKCMASIHGPVWPDNGEEDGDNGGEEDGEKHGERDGPDGDNVPNGSVVGAKTGTAVRVNPYMKILSVILQSDKFPLPPFRAGYLSAKLQAMFRFKDMSCDSASKKRFDCHLRVGVEDSPNQSFVAAMAAVYKFAVNKGKTVSVTEFKKHICDNISIDHFMSLQNGNLVSLFDTKPMRYDEKAKESVFYQKIDKDDVDQVRAFARVCNAFVHFKEHLGKTDAIVDHTIMWDLVCGEYEYLFENGMNLVIFEVSGDDGDNLVDLLCPSNYYSSRRFDLSKSGGKGSVFLVKHGNRYEPIARVTTMSGTGTGSGSSPNIQFFIKAKQATTTRVSDEYDLLKKVGKYYDNCYPVPSIPSKYNYSVNVIRLKDDIMEYLTKHGYEKVRQVVNYGGKVIGLYCEKMVRKKLVRGVVPCYPGYIDVTQDFAFYVDNSLYATYGETVRFFAHMSKESKTAICVEPPKKVVRGDRIVGLMTPLNHFVKIYPPVKRGGPNDVLKLESTDIMFVGKEDEYMDALIYEHRGTQDDARIMYTKKIRLENFIYTMFRHKLKTLLERPDMIENKTHIVDIIGTPHYMYSHKVAKVVGVVKEVLSGHYVVVDTFTQAFLKKVDVYNITNYVMDEGIREDGMVEELGVEPAHKLMVPSKNLITGEDNEDAYFVKLADELVRFPSLRKYILDPKGYIEAVGDEHNVGSDEVIYPESAITRDMLSLKARFSSYSHPHEQSFDTTRPIKTIINRVDVNYGDPVASKKKGAPVLKATAKGGGMGVKKVSNRARRTRRLTNAPNVHTTPTTHTTVRSRKLRHATNRVIVL